jgi:hypothetical protein
LTKTDFKPASEKLFAIVTKAPVSTAAFMPVVSWQRLEVIKANVKKDASVTYFFQDII